MISKIKDFINSMLEQDEVSADDHNVAIAALLCEVSHADHCLNEEEDAAIEKTLAKLFSIDQQKAKALLDTGKKAITSSNSLFDFTSQLKALEHDIRIKFISAMWEVAYADNYLDPIEEAIIRKVAALIYVGHSDFIRTKLAAMPAADVDNS